ncbi:hypothetical protein BHE74_00032626 [Ensete ventricosum]|nr:hypothetical protein BHE74_00032626 [Ensete ventricosum]
MEASEPGRPGAGAAGTGELYGSKGKGSQDPELDGLGLATGKAMNGEGSEGREPMGEPAEETSSDVDFKRRVAQKVPCSESLCYLD